MFQAFFDFLRDLPTPFDMVVAIVAISCTAGVVGTIARQVRVYADHEADRRLKRDLYESGYAAEDAQKVVDMDVTADYDDRRQSA